MEKSLQKLLMMPLYYLFPLRTKNFDCEVMDTNQRHMTLNEWIKSDSEHSEWTAQPLIFSQNCVQSSDKDILPEILEELDIDAENENSLYNIVYSNILIGIRSFQHPMSFRFKLPTRSLAESLDLDFYFQVFKQSLEKIQSKSSSATVSIFDVQWTEMTYFNCITDKEKLENWWETGFKGILKRFRDALLDTDVGFIKGADISAGIEMLIIWRNIDVNGDVTSINIAPIELKDRRNTESNEWTRKTKVLMGYDCVLTWIPLILGLDVPVYKHLIFCGREHQ